MGDIKAAGENHRVFIDAYSDYSALILWSGRN